ncbi:hypothetical protein [Phormidium sp. CCY1219]|uniref:hypothetical protein n=1 Tax=Phormidium sp. CCY1219 TaxID=2886104 RepID=UPI002D783FB7|nr:hypothetical protein [Phormidium sp. CCY1219]
MKSRAAKGEEIPKQQTGSEEKLSSSRKRRAIEVESLDAIAKTARAGEKHKQPGVCTPRANGDRQKRPEKGCWQ